MLFGCNDDRLDGPSTWTRRRRRRGECELGAPAPPRVTAASPLTALPPGTTLVHEQVLNNIHLISTLNIIVVFLISGLVLKTDDIMVALKNWCVAGLSPCRLHVEPLTVQLYSLLPAGMASCMALWPSWA